MAKKDEYSYPDQVTTEEYSDAAVSATTENAGSILTNKRILIPIGIMLVAVLASFLFDSQSDEPSMEVTPEPVDVTEVAPPPPVLQPQVDMHALEVVKTQQRDELAAQKQQLDEVRARSGAQMNEVQRLTHGIKGQQQDIAMVKGDVMALAQELRTVNASLAALSNQIELLRNPPKVEPVKAVVKPKLVHFHVRAMIEGRAWIREGKAGKSLSVAVGDKVPTYGEIEKIDLAHGMITTTSGRTIAYLETES